MEPPKGESLVAVLQMPKLNSGSLIVSTHLVSSWCLLKLSLPSLGQSP